MSLKLSNPIATGQLRACFNATSIANADWNNLTSADFLDTVSGAACAAGLKFASLTMINKGWSTGYLKYRALTLVTDPTTNEIAITGGSVWSDDLVTLEASVDTIAYKKPTAGAEVLFIAGFNR